MITFLLGVVIGAALILLQLPFLLFYLNRENEDTEAREGDDRP